MIKPGVQVSASKPTGSIRCTQIHIIPFLSFIPIQDECGCCKDDSGNDLECPPSPIQLGDNVTGVVSVKPFGDNATDLIMFHGDDNEGGVVAIQIMGDNETGFVTAPLHGDDMNEHGEMAPDVHDDESTITAEKTEKASTDNSEEQTDPDSLSAIEQAAAESSGALNRLHRALISTTLAAAVGIHSLW